MNKTILLKLRDAMKQRNLNAYILPKNDEFQSSYQKKENDRLYKLTNFTGSNGMVVVFADQMKKPIFLTDNRYKLQSKAEIDSSLFDIKDPETNPELIQLLIQNLQTEQQVGIDGSLFQISTCDRLTQHLGLKKMKLNVNNKQPLIDECFDSKSNQVGDQSLKFYQLKDMITYTFEEKLKRIKEKCKYQNYDVIFVSKIEEVNWLLNIRAIGQYENDPLFNGFMLVDLRDSRHQLFLDSQCINEIDRQNLRNLFGDSEIHDITDFGGGIERFKDRNVAIDTQSCSQSFYEILVSSCKSVVKLNSSPVSEVRVVKHDEEIKQIRKALEFESAALITLYATLQKRLNSKSSTLYESDVPEILQELRIKVAKQNYTGLHSFPMICGSGPNGAIIHYRAEKGKDNEVKHNIPVLIDTGGQYYGGTTDTTRTLLFKKANSKLSFEHEAELKEHYTRVLMGHIDLQTSVFPRDQTYGYQLDSIARRHLWKVSKDFRHGVGHFVSFCGTVHEYPHLAYAKSMTKNYHLQEGMVLTNEPGYYEEGKYGIRIENIMLVKNIDSSFTGFEPLTLVPYAKNMIIREMLSQEQLNSIKSYYDKIEEKIIPVIEKELSGKDKNAALDYFKNERDII